MEHVLRDREAPAPDPSSVSAEATENGWIKELERLTPKRTVALGREKCESPSEDQK
jgi:hypothetical protein